jgi:hypothetical protein
MVFRAKEEYGIIIAGTEYSSCPDAATPAKGARKDMTCRDRPCPCNYKV